MAELVDAHDLKSCVLTGVPVRPRPGLPFFAKAIAPQVSVWQDLLASNTHIYFFLWHDDHIVGMTGLIENDSNGSEVFLTASYIASDHRGKGLAHDFYKIRIDEAKNRGYKTILCSFRQSNKTTHALLEKHGFSYLTTVDELWPPDNTPEQKVYYKLDL